ncbi:hypothetical protein LZ575_20790 [Antarcticibacterium sp. 1MA-6-2]|uniref:beta strand repeat-containing protein n=1 Tax=Antarcticibacterium sp. 1MA-6-2 TaxID=2908210 RepID=UPI001F15E071|nr:immunoglobulin domain-containing protein [Antarcticibacterium sp. 1MA-6-2]UJH91067.1 hypothetical protein LZ575_20790 [Antarcticibacterium sp. 1MA-6-2]
MEYCWGSLSTNSITVEVTGAAQSGRNVNIIASAKNACGTSSQKTFSVNVNNSASVYAGLDATICKGGSIVLSGENNGYAQNYEWTATPAVGEFSNNKLLNPTYNPPPAFTGTISLKLISTKQPGNVKCPVVADEMILTVNEPATAVAGTAITACSNAAVNITTGSSASNNAGINWTSNGTGTIANPTSLTEATYTPGTNETGLVTLTLTATGNTPCANAVSTKIVTISKAPTAVAGTAITACSDAAINMTAGSSATNHTGITWTSNGTGTITNPTSLTTATYTPGANEIGPVILTLTATGNSPCASAVSTKSLTISKAPTAVAGIAVTACSNAAVNITEGSSATNNTGIVWTSNGTGTISNPTSLTEATYTPGNGETGPVTLTLTATGNTPCANAASTKTLTISQAATAVAGTAITACSNAAINVTAGSSASNNTGIVWTSNGTGTITNPTSLTEATYTPAIGETGFVTLTLTATGITPCANAVSTKTLTISQAATAVAGTAITACSNTAINITAGSSATNNTGIVWTSNGTGTIADPTSLTEATYTPGNGETGPVTLTLTATGITPCANAVSTKTLTISQAATAIAGTAVTACSNAPISITEGSSASNYGDILWTSNGTGTIANPTSLTEATYTPGNGETGSVTLTLTATGNTPCGNAVSTKALTINQKVLIISQPNPSQIVCAGFPFEFEVEATGTNLTYQWQLDGVDIPGATSAHYSVSQASSTHKGKYKVLVKGSDPCTDEISNEVQLEVNQSITFATGGQPTAEIKSCVGDSNPIILSVTAEGTISEYLWRKDNIPLSDGGNISGATTAQLTISNQTPDDSGSYDVVISSPAESCSQIISNPSVVTVNSKSADPTSVSTSASENAICLGDSTVLTLNGGGGGTGEEIRWYTDSNGTNQIGTGNNLEVSPEVTRTYYGRYEDPSECATPSAFASVEVTVNYNSTIELTSAEGSDEQTICINNPLTSIIYQIGGGGDNAVLTGDLPEDVIGLFADGKFTISGTPSESGTFDYTVTTEGPCNQESLSGTIIVNADSVIALSSPEGTDDQTLCINTSITPISYTVSAGATSANLVEESLRQD